MYDMFVTGKPAMSVMFVPFVMYVTYVMSVMPVMSVISMMFVEKVPDSQIPIHTRQRYGTLYPPPPCYNQS
jgi:hypothetical protein